MPEHEVSWCLCHPEQSMCSVDKSAIQTSHSGLQEVFCPLRFYRPEHLGIQDWHLTFPSTEQGCPLNWEEWQWPPFCSRCFVIHTWSGEDLCPSLRALTAYDLGSLSGLVRTNKWKQNQDQPRTSFKYLAPQWKLHAQSWIIFKCFQHSTNGAGN